MSPTSDQSFNLTPLLSLVVLPNLILFPHLPWNILSPVKDWSGWILDLSIKVFWVGFAGLLKSISVELSLTFLISPPAWEVDL